ncbi:RNA-binding S4 domain-containing protein [Actinokineospora bangkokensis]|uniref:RNA-binding protein n=1 Tax=Actinokineospora bangkokensis TaxID=1193682 RepID=A0A1Q9LBU2_9PSEU|nr:RNA-binding S4 domain-containing protein [Actinokineospora bangkokensis]OLR89501.1 RNA-binding protein [Actinokineospora bangkokensis]
MREVREVEIRDGMIRLGQLLKLAGVAEDGAHAKDLLEAGEVAVNGEVEHRRGRQIHPGDTIQAATTHLKVTTPTP